MVIAGLAILVFGFFLLTIVIIPSGNRLVIGSRLPRIHTLDSLIRYSDYRMLWTGNFFANSAQWFQLLSIGWLVRDLSAGSASSAVQVVTVGGMVTLPVLLVTPWGGVLGDRLNRRKLIMTTNAGMAVLAAAFALLVESGLVQVSHAYLYVLFSGVGLAIVQPTRQALIANTVPRDAIGHAYATNTFTIAGTRMIGPFFGGIVIASLGFTWNFVVEAALYLGVVLALMPMKTPYQAQARPATPTMRPSRRISPFSDLAEGIRYVWRDEPAIFQIMLLSMVANVVIHPVLFMLPLFTADVLHQGADVGGYLLAASGFGALASAMTIATVGFVFRKGRLALGSVVAAAIATIMFAYMPWLSVALFLCALFSAGLNANRTASGTLVQLLAPDRLRSRIIGLQNYFMGFVVFTSLLIGWFAGVTSVTTAIAAVGVVGLVLSIAYFILLGKVRNLD
jgi:MFS family permease